MNGLQHSISIFTVPSPPLPAGNLRTESLLQLASCTPLKARTPDMEWDQIVTPYRVAVWEQHVASHPHRGFAEYICKGIREGFRIGFDYHHAQCKPGPGNMKSAKEHTDIVDKYIGSECNKKRLLGPLQRSKYPQVQVSPFGSNSLIVLPL